MTRATAGAIATVLWALAIAIAILEGWWGAWVVVGIGLGHYAARVEILALAEIRRRDGSVVRREWRAGR